MAIKRFTSITEAIGNMSVDEIRMSRIMGRNMTIRKTKKEPEGFKLNTPITRAKSIISPKLKKKRVKR